MAGQQTSRTGSNQAGLHLTAVNATAVRLVIRFGMLPCRPRPVASRWAFFPSNDFSCLRRMLSGTVRLSRLVWVATLVTVAGVAAPAEPGPASAIMQARIDPATGQVDLTESGRPVLRYNYRTREPGDLLAQVHPDNRKYARARSDYIHPLFGLNGEELTKDWSVDHPHHRGIYWAWPEVDYRGERGDLHALQRVFARPTGRCVLEGGETFAQIEAENEWLWEDREPIVRERVLIRAFKADREGRWVDLEFQFTALGEDVAVARRGTEHYGGLNIRLAAVKNQRITTHTDPPGSNPRMAWADLSGTFDAGQPETGLSIFQHPENPEYPGDWVQYPELNWLQPTFPAAQRRWVLKKGQPLVLRFRLWIHRSGQVSEETLADAWRTYRGTPRITQ